MNIRTRHNPPTNTKGSTVTAFFNGKQRTVPYDHALDTIGNHLQAAGYFMEAENLEFNGQVADSGPFGYRLGVEPVKERSE